MSIFVRDNETACPLNTSDVHRLHWKLSENVSFQDSLRALALMASSLMGVHHGAWDQAHLPQQHHGDSGQMGGGGFNFLVTLQQVWLLGAVWGLRFARARLPVLAQPCCAWLSVHAARPRWGRGLIAKMAECLLVTETTHLFWLC